MTRGNFTPAPPPLKEKFWRYVEASAQSSNLFLVQFSFAIQNFRHDTGRSENIRQVFLQQVVLLRQEPQNIQRLPARKPVAFLLEILDQERQQLREFLLRRRQPRATPVEIVKNLRIRLIFLLRPDHLGTNFSQKRFIFGADG